MSTKKIQIFGSLGNKVYVQNDEPIDAKDGSLWVDLDEEGENGVNIGNSSHVKYINNQDKDNRISLRSLESGVYIVLGYFVWYDGGGNVHFNTEQHVIINRNDEKTEMQMFYPVNNRVLYVYLTDTNMERTDVYLNKVAYLEDVESSLKTITDLLIDADLAPVITDGDGAVIAEADGAILLNL